MSQDSLTLPNTTDIISLTVIVPVYEGFVETKSCIESALKFLPEWADLLIVNDASPNDEITDYCNGLKGSERIEVLVNTENLGFVGSVNKAMSAAGSSDVVLLNSDTQVNGDWIKRLQDIAYKDPAIATVTPFSNNATICSYPTFCADNSMLPEMSLAQIDDVFSSANDREYIALPTAVGFCMYIKRECIDQVGLFDEASFGRGYGEENDFCLRAIKLGWQNVLAANVFVYHQGSVSFAEDKASLVRRAESVINDLYPEFFTTVSDFVKSDPVKVYRDRASEIILASEYKAAAIVLSRIEEKSKALGSKKLLDSKTQVENEAAQVDAFFELLAKFSASTKPKLLFITHAWGGGVEQHVQDLLLLLKENYEVCVLRGLDHESLEVNLSHDQEASHNTLRRSGFNHKNFSTWLALFSNINFSRVHLHHTHGWDSLLLDFITALKVPYDITLHDYYSLSANYHCQEVEADKPSADDWHDDKKRQALFSSLMTGAERIIAPSIEIKEKVSAVYSGGHYVVAAHPESVLEPPTIVKVVLLGGLSEAKGLAVVQAVAKLAATCAPALKITLIGHAADVLNENINVTGSYNNQDLPTLIAEHKPDVIWLPSQVPETYCYTLTHALAAGLPIVASKIGAIAERLADVKRANLLPFNASAEQWIESLLAAGGYKPREPQWYVDTLSTYKTFYCKPIEPKQSSVQPLDARYADFLRDVPLILPVKDTPINDLFRIGVYGGHKDSLHECERRLVRVPGDEFGVVGLNQYRSLENEYQNLHVELEDTRNAAARDVGFLTRELNQAQDNLLTAKENISLLQQQAVDAQKHIDHMESANQHLTREQKRLEQEVAALIASFSWKVTRPMRVLKRGTVRAYGAGIRILRHSVRPASYARAFKLIRCGEWRTLFGRIEYENQMAQEQAAVSKIEPPAAVDQALLVSTQLTLTPFSLATSNSPELSIVIPVYGQHETTYACLKSIADSPPSIPFEIIVMDDCSPEPAEDILSVVAGVRIIRNEQNLGFVGNMNAGGQAAKGEWLVLLNNDTVVVGDAFDQLIKTFDAHKNVGLVGAKLLNNDGSLQEAGGIIWRDGSGWNWGRGADRRDPRFNFVRDADYCSGAVLAISRELFLGLEGFDTYYAPAYYEDTDIAFRVRAKGLRVLYQPAAEVYHLEGVTHGRDESSGMKAYQVTNAKKFYQRWQDVLSNHAENSVNPENEAHRATKGNILVVEACMITPDQDSGSIRMLNLLQILVSEGYHVTFVADNLEYREKPVQTMTAMGVEVLFNQWAGSVRNVIRTRGKDLDFIFLCRHYIASQYVTLARTCAPKARLIFDTVDLHFVREEREAELANNPQLVTEAAITRRKELNLIASTDVTVVVSNFEKTLLADLVPTASVDIVSNIHSHTPERPGYSTREGILFVGGFRHTPNIDAIIWYAQEVMPHLVKLLPGVVTTVIGSNMTPEVAALNSEFLDVKGFVEDITDNLTGARVSIAPLRYGAGVKGKVNEAMNYGIPVVSTVCGVEGMHLTPEEHVLVADDPKAFAQAVVRAYQDQALWEKLSQAGIANVDAHFSPVAALPAVRRILA